MAMWKRALIIFLAAAVWCTRCAAYPPLGDNAPGVSMARAGITHLEAARWEEAGSNFLLALDMGRESNSTLAQGLAQYGLGVLAREQGDYALALEHLQAAAAVLDEESRQERTVLTQAYLAAAGVLLDTDKPDRALAYIDSAYEIADHERDEALRLRAQFLRARVYTAVAAYQRAMEMFLDVLDQQVAVVGFYTTDVAKTCLEIGALYETADDFPPAWDYYYEAMHILEKVRGTEHPHTARAYAALGNLASLTGDYAYAAQMLQRAMDVQEVGLGRRHPDHADTSAALGMLYLNTDQYDHALAALNHSLEVDQRHFGEPGLRTARDYMYLGKIFLSRMKLTQAADMMNRSLIMRSFLLPDNHPDVAEAMNNLAVCMYHNGEYEQAMDLQRKALRVDAASFATATTEISTAQFNNLATLTAHLDEPDPARAVEYYRQAILAQKHETDSWPLMLAALHQNLGAALDAAGDLPAALEAYSEALKQIRWALGTDNQLVADAYLRVAECSLKLGDLDEAEKNYKYFLKITYPQDQQADQVIRLLEDLQRWRVSEPGPQYVPRYLGPEPDPVYKPRYLGQE